VKLARHVRKAGCASKIGSADLKRVLAELPSYDDPNVLVGVAAADDAGIYRIDGEYNLVQTVDVFSPVVDDPYVSGQIGTGVISFASQIGCVSDDAVQLASRSMATLNKDAAELMLEFDAHACTDVTGFSLLGHLCELARRSEVTARLDASSVPVFAEAFACVRYGVIPGAVERNREAYTDEITTEGKDGEDILSLLYDAQTSVGLLIGLPKQDRPVQVVLGEPAEMIGTYRVIEPAEAASVEVCCEHPPADLSCCADSDEGIHAPAPAAEPGPAPPAPGPAADAFKGFMKSVNAPGQVDVKTKRLLNIALSIAQRCEPCLQIHLEAALSEGLSRAEIDEVAWLTVSFCGAPAKMLYEEMWKELDRP